MTASNRAQGLTLIEVLIAIVIVSLTMTLLSGAIISSVKNDRNSGQRTQAAQVMNVMSRLVVEGAAGIIPSASATEVTWDYGDLKTTFPELTNKKGLSNPDLYRATVTRTGDLILAGVRVRQYDLEVCWQSGAEEKCVAGFTAGPTTAQTFIGN